MSTAWPVAWIGSGIADVLLAPATGRVHSVFERACNLLLDGGPMLALLYPELPRTPWGLHLAENATGELTQRMSGMFTPGDPFQLCAESAEIEFSNCRVRVQFEKARVWDASLKAHSKPQPFTPSPKAVHVLEERLHWTKRKILHKNFSRLDTIVTRRLQEGAAQLRMALQPRNEVEKQDTALQQAAFNLMGLGPGLTPAGDDMLVGALAALTLSAPANKAATSLLASLRHWVSSQAIQRTSPVAAVFMLHACAGLFAENLLNTLEALRTPEAVSGLQDAAEHLLAFGASSGADTLTGILCVLTSPLFSESAAATS